MRIEAQYRIARQKRKQRSDDRQPLSARAAPANSAIPITGVMFGGWGNSHKNADARTTITMKDPRALNMSKLRYHLESDGL
jgi:hypothetical protein